MKVFVINICDKRWKKYESDERYIRWKGCNGKEDLDYDFIEETYITMWNCSKEHKCNVAGCGESHLTLMKHIIDNQLNNVIIIEDDALVDFDRLEELNDINEFCFVGGRFEPRVLKKKVDRDKCSMDEGINIIDPEHFTIGGAHGYYFPTYEVCSWLYNIITKKQRRRAIDSEFRILQKNKQITKYIFPAIVDLHLPDAMNGFTYNAKSNYHLKDNNHYY